MSDAETIRTHQTILRNERATRDVSEGRPEGLERIRSESCR